MIPKRARLPGSLTQRGRQVAGAARRFSWGIADQALSSLTNFAVAFLVARNVETSEFGAFSLAFTTYLIVMGLSRTISTSPIVIRYSTVSDDVWRRGVAWATGTALALGTVLGLLGVAISVLYLDGTLRVSFLALSACLPGLMLQDAWRFAFFAKGKGLHSFVNDFIWAVVLVPTLVVMDLLELGTTGWFILAWGGAASVAAISGIFQSGVIPLPHRAWSWWKQHRDLTAWFLGDWAVGHGLQQATIYILALLTSLRAIGGLKAVSLLFGPINILILGLTLVAVPEGARMLQASTRKLRIMVAVISICLVLATLLWGIAASLLPSTVGEFFLGDSWDSARSLAALQMLFVISTAAAVGPRMALAALEAAKQTFWGRVLVSAFIVTCPAIGAVTVGSARGILWGAIVAEAAAACIWFVQYLRAERSYMRSTEVATLES